MIIRKYYDEYNNEIYCLMSRVTLYDIFGNQITDYSCVWAYKGY